MELVFERLSYVSIEAHQPASTNDTDTLSISGLDYHRHHCLHQQQQPSLADSTMLDSVNITPSSQSTGLSAGRLTSLFGPYTYMIRIMDFSLPRPFAPGSESSRCSRCGTFAPWNFRSLELSLPGTFAPWTFRSLELSLPGTFAPTNKCRPSKASSDSFANFCIA